MTTQLISLPYHLPRDSGTALWHLGALLTFKATSEQTAGRMWAKELSAPQGMATPMHRHSREDEAFYVLDGEVSVYVGDQVVPPANDPPDLDALVAALAEHGVAVVGPPPAPTAV